LRVISEKKHGFASNIYWQCDSCNSQSNLNTSPQKNKSYEINTRFVAGLKTSSCGGSYKVCETIAAHLDMPSISRESFFQKSKVIGQTIQSTTKESCDTALQGIFNYF
jgi:hypothetical protein